MGYATFQFQHPLYDDSLDIEFPDEALDFYGHNAKYERGDEAETFGYGQIGEWRDTILVPPLSNITVRFRTDSFTGDVITHCHLTGDEDQGMMMVTQIVGEDEDLTANELSGDAAPGSCMPDGYYVEKYSRLISQFVSNFRQAMSKVEY